MEQLCLSDNFSDGLETKLQRANLQSVSSTRRCMMELYEIVRVQIEVALNYKDQFFFRMKIITIFFN